MKTKQQNQYWHSKYHGRVMLCGRPCKVIMVPIVDFALKKKGMPQETVHVGLFVFG